jgi:hypothetical protein
MLGHCSIGGAIFLEILVFMDIATQGYFLAMENNPFILMLEFISTFLAVVYFTDIYVNFVKSVRTEVKPIRWKRVGKRILFPFRILFNLGQSIIAVFWVFSNEDISEAIYNAWIKCDD